METNLSFLHPKLRPSSLDKFHIRNSIITGLEKAIPHLQGSLLDVGCGSMPYKEFILSKNVNIKSYVGLDLANSRYQSPDLIWDGHVIPLQKSTVDCAIATEVLEHCPNPQNVIDEIYRVLKPGGIFFFTVPFLWNLHDIPNDEYRYTPFALERFLKQAGFEKFSIQASGGWDASLGQMLGLWVRRRFAGSKGKRVLRGLLSIVLTPVVWSLYKIDRVPQEIQGSLMITGIVGTAQKL